MNIQTAAGDANVGFYFLPPILHDPYFLAGFTIVATIALILKGYSLWHAAQKKQRNWFIALLIINSLGILEIVYLYKQGLIGNTRKRA